jgi:NADH dehydrogenase FAD-containing subunit
MMKEHLQYRTGTKCIEIAADGVRVLNQDGAEELVEADTVVYAVGLKAHTAQALALCNAASRQYFVIGDCLSARKVKQAVHEGYHAAMDIR